MASKWETIGDAIVTSLNAATLSQSFTAARKYRPYHEQKTLESESAPRVYVIPASRSSDSQSRRPSHNRSYLFDIEIHKYIASADTVANVDEWATLAEEIEDHLIDAGNMASAVWVSSENDEPFDPDALFTQNIFSTALRVGYRYIK